MMNVQRLKQSCQAQQNPDLKDGVILELIEMLESAEKEAAENLKGALAWQRRAETAETNLLSMDKQMSHLEQAGIAERDRRIAAEAKLEVREGWKLVPIIAFPSQWAIGQKAFDSAGTNKVDAVYKAMVAAAPEVE